MNSSRGTTPDCTIEIYEDSESSYHGSDTISNAKNPSLPADRARKSYDTHAQVAADELRDGSETEVVDEGDEDYDDHLVATRQLDIVKRVEDPVFEVSYDNDRNFSSATAIRLGDCYDDPFVDDEVGDDEQSHTLEGDYEEFSYADREYDGGEDDEEGEYDRDRDEQEQEDDDEDEIEGEYVAESRADDMDSASRHVSEFSTLPDEMDVPLPEAPTPPVWSQRSFRKAIDSPRSPHRSNRLLSSPQNGSGRDFSPSTSNAHENRFVSSPLARQSPSSAAFRNASSVRAMQLSSPSPPPSSGFTRSPRSARQRRLGLESNANSSRNGTPSRRHQLRQSSHAVSLLDGSPTPSKHPNPKKEYPLVLLHCSFSSPTLPYSPAVLRAVLPEEVQESITLLREKLGLTVLERGMLIPHPGEDYELLEERLLESLELKSPRLGKCGHFVGSGESRKSSARSQEDKVSTEEKNNLASEEVTDIHKSPTDTKCETCGRHVHDRHRGCAGDGLKRWDIRVYASNGLMRAGAWAAAWREMEKVDVEIGVWLQEETRVALEHEAQAEFEREGAHDNQSAYDMPMDEVDVLRQQPRGEAFGQIHSATGKAIDRSASTAACSRPTSRHHSRRQMQTERLPLSTLLLNFIKRTFLARSELLLQILVIVLVIALYKQWQSQAASPSLAMLNNESRTPVDMPHMVPMKYEKADVPGPLPNAASAPTPENIAEQQDEAWINIPACTFPVGAEGEAGMTALPADLARNVLSSAGVLTQEMKATIGMPEPEPTAGVTEMVDAHVEDNADLLGE